MLMGIFCIMDIITYLFSLYITRGEKMEKISLAYQILISLVIGVMVGTIFMETQRWTV
jgi:hypothetical protein